MGDLSLSSDGLPTLVAAAPLEFDGPGDRWSPESLLCAAVASCLILTFRAVSRASKFAWQHLECTVEGKLERLEGTTQFTEMRTKVVLWLQPTADTSLATRLLEKAEQGCLVANSLKSQRTLEVEFRRSE